MEQTSVSLELLCPAKMDDIRDPREIGEDEGEEEYGALTDEEMEEHERLYRNNEINEEEYKAMKVAADIFKRVSGKRKTQTDTQKTPDKAHVTKPLKSAEIKRQGDGGSTSYFVNMLEKSREKLTEEHQQKQSLLGSRVYTFGANIDVIVEDCDALDPISGQQLSKRYIEHTKLLEFFKEIKVLRLNKAMAKIVPPNFQEPKYPNWCCVGILCSKSAPRVTSNNSGRYVILAITDFKYTTDVYIFGEGVEKYNKLRVGDVIAILNPEIFVKRTPTTETFAFSISHSLDCILEIGKAKHFGQCPSIRKDGTLCGTFINKSTDSCCDFHKELRLSKTAGKRMEFQNSYRLNAHVKNGVKQTMYMLGRPDSKAMRVQIMDDRSAPRVDRISKARAHFSNDSAHKAFFNQSTAAHDMFEDPVKLKEKVKKQKERAQRIKEMELQKKLSLNFREGKKLIKAHGLEEGLDIKSKKDLLSAAFNKETLSNLGFDPTSRPSEKGLLSYNESDEKSDLLNELRKITKEKKIDLGASEEQILKRKEEKIEVLKMIKRLKTEKPTVKPEPNPPLPEVKKEKSKALENSVMIDSSSDEELEIEEKSFSKFKESLKK